jgi:hypothetical protein
MAAGYRRYSAATIQRVLLIPDTKRFRGQRARDGKISSHGLSLRRARPSLLIEQGFSRLT